MTLWKPLSRALATATLVPMLAVAAPPEPKPSPRPAPEPTTAPEAKGPARPSRQYTIEQLMGTTQVLGAAFNSDGRKVLYTSNQTGVFNVFSVPVGGGKPTRLTRSATDTTVLASAFPRDERLLFTRDQAGNELVHLYVRTPDGKERDLTPGDKLRARFAGWSQDESAFYVLTNERDPGAMDLYRHDAKTYARTRLFENDGSYDLGGVSPDEKTVALVKSATTSDSDVYLYDVATKAVKHITPHQGSAQYSLADFDPASGAPYLLTNDGSEFTRVVRYAKDTGKLEEVEKADWDILSTTFSRTGAYRVTAVNEDGHTLLRLYDVKAGTQVAVPRLPEGDLTSVAFARDEKRLAFLHEGDRSPTSVYLYDVGTKKATRLTDALPASVDAADLVDSRVVRFKSFDGLEIPGLLYTPHQATLENKVPAIVFVPGGPGGQMRKNWMTMFQYLVNHGYAVLAVNNRGTSGYGKTFFQADDQKHGREPLRDCVEARKYLAGLPNVDGTRVGIMGGSYGGYMVLAALAFHPDAFSVGVDAFGPSNWLRTLQEMPPEWGAFRQAMFQELGNPETQEAMLREISPLFHADKIRKPLLVFQGANDPRVHKVESDEIVAAVKKNKVPVEYVVFPDEGHGFSKPKNEAESSTRTLSFLDRYLKKPAVAAPTP